MFMLMLAFIVLLTHTFRLPAIPPALLVGIIAGAAELDKRMNLEAPVIAALIELGVVLLLFFAGLSTDYVSLVHHYNTSFWFALIQIIVRTAIFAALAAGSGLSQTVEAVIFFGLTCSFSSTLMTVQNLQMRGEMRTLHGRILRGSCVFKELISSFIIAIIFAFFQARVMFHSMATETSARRGEVNATSTDVASDGSHKKDQLGTEIGKAIGIYVLVCLILYGLHRLCLERVFKFFSKDSELLFIGIMAYDLGVGALGFLAGFSPMACSFLAGLSAAFLKQRVRIENKVSSLKDFGMITFYFMMGIYVQLDAASFGRLVPWSIIICFIITIVLPVLFWVFGAAMGLKGRTTFMICNTFNSMGETSLIMQSLAYHADIFDRDQYIVLLLSSLFSMVLGWILQTYQVEIYNRVKFLLVALENVTAEETEREKKFSYKDHIVLLGFNESGLEIANHFLEKSEWQKRDVLMLDLDPSLHRTMLTSFCGADASSHGDEEHAKAHFGTNIFPVYADPESELSWHRYRLRSASLVVCCTIDRDPKPLCKYMKGSNATLMVITNSNEEAKVLYDLGVHYAIQQEYLAALEVSIILKEEYQESSKADSLFVKRRQSHQEELKEEQESHIRRKIGEFM
ncbi:hypothetical protein GUITHDRAFT_146083 [Guillardia theta CCMP2712]|uniref:Cation/H+ exchanger transmembrane domain-containing protein n=1 Tax=Guillardia theta (strain CCMP2712) TaxID=905079 RepID=L1IJD9_GUITC|nr:hypothetical protein GUITHDRAFT_146083 [Guillardia theta CCMP2712]EKX36044.1 hypothetical protein GUITHDRAFT_146083 [Guillardia theta CCMP2712]|eukprot:XP_005823024.1 hypothetical protein GUITHDRAFT_146083 [Guillardia theta CCMP2712]